MKKENHILSILIFIGKLSKELLQGKQEGKSFKNRVLTLHSKTGKIKYCHQQAIVYGVVK
ncbi:MAG: hypothetical protein PHT33_13980 [bacterium]|nr:hypothetical protein [bacterium]